MKSIKAKVLAAGHIFFFILIVLSIFFYKERVLFFDSALQLFEMINAENFKFYVNRYGSIFSEILPVIFIKLHFSLSYVLLAYSLSFILIYYAVFIICVKYLNNIPAGIAIIAGVIIIRHAFFHAITETYIALAYGALFYAFLCKKVDFTNKRKLIFHILIGIFIILLCYSIHFISAFFIVFAIGYKIINDKDYKNPLNYTFLLGMIIIFGLKFFFPDSAYEDSFFAELKNFNSILPHFWGLPSVLFLKDHFLDIYIYPLILLILLSFILITRRKILVLLWVYISLIGFMLVTGITYHKGYIQFAMEVRYLPFIYFIILPLVTELMESPKIKTVTTSVLVGSVIAGLVGIIYTGNTVFSKRITYYKQLLAQTHCAKTNKLLIENKNVSMDVLQDTWGASIESLLLSSLRNPEDSQTIFICDNASSISDDVYKSNISFLYTPWWVYFSANDHNKHYFKLDSNTYKYIDRSILFKDYNNKDYH